MPDDVGAHMFSQVEQHSRDGGRDQHQEGLHKDTRHRCSSYLGVADSKNRYTAMADIVMHAALFGAQYDYYRDRAVPAGRTYGPIHRRVWSCPHGIPRPSTRQAACGVGLGECWLIWLSTAMA